MDFGATRPISHFQYVHHWKRDLHPFRGTTAKRHAANWQLQWCPPNKQSLRLKRAAFGSLRRAFTFFAPHISIAKWVSCTSFGFKGLPKIRLPPNHPSHWTFSVLKAMVLGYPHFRNPPMCIVNGIYEPTNETEGGHHLVQIVANVISIFPCKWHVCSFPKTWTWPTVIIDLFCHSTSPFRQVVCCSTCSFFNLGKL